MRTSKDIYKTKSGELYEVGGGELPPPFSKIYTGYDYQNQCWMFEGKKDTRTLEQLQNSIAGEVGQKNENALDKFFFGN